MEIDEKKIMAFVFVVVAIILMLFAYRDNRVVAKYNDLVDKYNELYVNCTYGNIPIEEETPFYFRFNIT